MISFGGFGSVGRTTYVFIVDGKPYFRCGCFRGDIDAFRAQVKHRRGDTRYATEYLLIADMVAKLYPGEKEEANNE